MLGQTANPEKLERQKMGRPRAFSEAEALDAAMRVFWEKGYEGTTLDDLTRAMSINRSSLYATFGDKETLFRHVIRRYSSGPMASLWDALKQPTARAVVEARLAACVNILPGTVTSIYRWKGKVESAQEQLLLIKTSRKRLGKLQAAVERLHSYEVPEFIALPIAAGSRKYLAWLE